MAEPAMNNKAMTEAEIQRRHILFQTSYTGGAPWTQVPGRSKSPMKRENMRRPKIVKRLHDVSPVPKRTTSMTSVMTSRGSSPSRKKTQTVKRVPAEDIDDRRLVREERRRPWKEKAPKTKPKNYSSVLFYDKALPTHVSKDDIIMRPRRYVSNTKYGDIYELRQEFPRKSEKAPPARKWLWEDEFLLWQKGSRAKYLEDFGTKTKTNVTVASTGNTTGISKHGKGYTTLPSIKENSTRPSADLYA